MGKVRNRSQALNTADAGKMGFSSQGTVRKLNLWRRQGFMAVRVITFHQMRRERKYARLKSVRVDESPRV